MVSWPNLYRIINLFRFGKTIQQSAARSTLILYFNKIWVQLLNIFRTFLLALFLTPYDLGILGIGLISYSLFDKITRTGTKTALIAFEGDITKYLNSSFTITFFRNLILFSFIQVSAISISNIFEEPSSLIYIRVVGLIYLINAFSNPATVYFRKNLDFRKESFQEVLTDISNMTLTIILLIIFKNIWSVIIGLIFGYFIKLIVGYKLISYKPKFDFNKNNFVILFNYSIWIFLSSIVGFLIIEGDDILVGILLGTSFLGLYQMAYKFGNLPVTQFSTVLAQIAIPTYSKIKSDSKKLYSTFDYILKLNISIVSYLVLIVYWVVKFLVLNFFDIQWHYMIPTFEILILASWFRSLSSNVGPLLLSKEKPKNEFLIQSFRLTIIIITIFPFIENYGIQGAAYSILLSIFLTNFVYLKFLIREINYRIFDYLFAITIPLITVFTTHLVMKLSEEFLILNFSIYNLLFFSITSSIFYFTLLYIFSKIFNYNVFQKSFMLFNSILE